MTVKIGILLSGSGSTYVNMQEQIDAGLIDANIAVVISSRTKAGAVVHAERFGHRYEIAREADDVTALLRDANCDLVLMCGYMRFYNPPADFAMKTLNVHPSLLPSFGGQGMYGHHVHEAVLAHGAKISGCTVHVVDGAYDSGPILAQKTVPVFPGDNMEDLQTRVQAAERDVYPRVVAAFVESGLQQLPSGQYYLPAFDYSLD